MSSAFNSNVTPTEPVSQAVEHIDVRAVIGGALGAAAISTLLVALGSAIGLSMTSARPYAGFSTTVIAVLAAVWLALVHIGALAAGGYLSARLRARAGGAATERYFRDGAHGFFVWALVMLIGAYVLTTGIASAVKGTAEVAGTTAGIVAQGAGTRAAAAVAPDPLGYTVDTLLRRTPQTPQTGPLPTPRDEAVNAEIGRIIVLSGASDRISHPADRQYLIALIASRAGVSPADAERRLDEAWTRYVALRNEAEAKARDVGEKARRAALVSAFVAFGVSLAGLMGAVWGAGIGGEHRDRNVVLRVMGRDRFW